MIDIFTVLVTFLLMTAVFSRTVVLELNLPQQRRSCTDLPKDLQLEVLVRHDLLEVADRNTGPLKDLPNTAARLRLRRPDRVSEDGEGKVPDKTDASVLLEKDTPYDILVQVMDRVRVFETQQASRTVQAELFPTISVGDVPP